MRKAFKYRIYLTNGQRRILEQQLEEAAGSITKRSPIASVPTNKNSAPRIGTKPSACFRSGKRIALR
jgi:hypothetical protein